MRFCTAFSPSHTGVSSLINARAPGIEIGRPEETYRRVRIESKFGKLTALVSDGHLPYPYGRELTGYEVSNLDGYSDEGKEAAWKFWSLPSEPTSESRPLCNSRVAHR